jgi:hypothetical protein
MSLLYPRTVEVRRLRRDVAPAVLAAFDPEGGYSGAEQNTVSDDPNSEVSLYRGICCSIQAMQSGRTKDGFLPTDATTRPQWKILIQPGALPIYSVRDRDIVIDDEGYRHQVSQNCWTGLTYELSCVRLEA